jgi:hypothetical protein
MDVEFITDHDTEDALLQWCARRRREVIPGSAYLLGAGAFILLDMGVLWRHTDSLSVAFVIAMLLQVAAFGFAAIARDPERPQPIPCPQAELTIVGLLLLALVVTFNHKPSVLAFLLLTVLLTDWVVIAFRGWHGFAFVRDRVPFYGRAQHVHLDARGIDLIVRPNPAVRHLPWKSVRYVGADADGLFVVGRWSAIVVPRRAFPSRAAWDDFVAATAGYAEAALKSPARAPIGRHVRGTKARRA